MQDAANMFELCSLLMQQKLSSMLNHVESPYIPRCLNKIVDSLARISLFVEGILLRECFPKLDHTGCYEYF